MDPTHPLDAKGIDWLCDKLSAGESQRAISAELGIGIATLGRWIAADPERSARAREARIVAARAFDEMAEQVLTDAEDAFGLAKARELASHYRWKASKANPREYGDKVTQELTGANGGPINNSLTIEFVNPPQ